MVKEQTGRYSYAISVAAATVVILVVAGLFVVKPLWDTVSKMDKEKKAKADTLTEMKRRETVLLSLKDKEEQLKKDSETISNALPTQGDIGRLFIQLDSLATASGGSLKSVAQTSNTATSSDSSVAGITEQTYAIPLDMPTYFALKQFITSSEAALRLLSITNLKIDVSDAGKMSVNIIAKSYARSE